MNRLEYSIRYNLMVLALFIMLLLAVPLWILSGSVIPYLWCGLFSIIALYEIHETIRLYYSHGTI